MVRALSTDFEIVAIQVVLTAAQGIFVRRLAHLDKDPEGKYYPRLRERSSRGSNSSVLSIKVLLKGKRSSSFKECSWENRSVKRKLSEQRKVVGRSSPSSMSEIFLM